MPKTSTQDQVTLALPADQAAALQGLLALIGTDQTPTEAPEPTPEPDVPAHEALMEERGVKPAKGSTVLTADAVKAAARVVKSSQPEIVASPEGNGDHVVIFTTDKGNVRVQNAYTPKD